MHCVLLLLHGFVNTLFCTPLSNCCGFTEVICSKKSELDDAGTTQLVVMCLMVVESLLHQCEENQALFTQLDGMANCRILSCKQNK